jgi:hypothetical protein
MRSVFAILLCLFVIAVKAQSPFGAAPQDFKKVKFTYLQHSRFKIDESGVYADTTFMKECFLKDKMKIESNDRGAVYGFVRLSELDDKEKKTLIGILSHNNFVIKGIYNKVRQTTKIEYVRDGEAPDDTQALLKKLFGETYTSRVNKRIDLNFESGSRYYESGMVSEDTEIDVGQNLLQLHPDPEKAFIGSYQERINGRTLTNIAITNDKLNRYISPILPFGNTGGVEQIISTNYTIELYSVEYEE